MSALGRKQTLRSNRNASRDARTIHCVELVVATRHKLSFESRLFIRMFRIERCRQSIVYPVLNIPRYLLSCVFINHSKHKINACCNSTPGYHFSILHHSGLFVGSSDEWQEISISPVRRSTAALQKTGHTQNECARAN